MNRKGGTVFGALLVTILGISYLPRQDTGSKFSQETEEQNSPGRTKTTARQSVPTPIAACQQIAKRLERFYSADIPAPNSCFLGVPASNQPRSHSTAHMDFLIMLVPDPVRTHFALYFGRLIEAVQQAAQDESYVYDDSWFPWEQTEQNYQLLRQQEVVEQLSSKRKEQPGIMVFRRGLSEKRITARYKACKEDDGNFPEAGSLSQQCKDKLDYIKPGEKRPHEAYEGGLVVFVVGEQPTGGIADLQFENALLWIQALGKSSSKEPLRILGPTFSGSLPSLARELSAANTFDRFKDGVTVYSGTVSAESSVGSRNS